MVCKNIIKIITKIRIELLILLLLGVLLVNKNIVRNANNKYLISSFSISGIVLSIYVYM